MRNLFSTFIFTLLLALFFTSCGRSDDVSNSDESPAPSDYTYNYLAPERFEKALHRFTASHTRRPVEQIDHALEHFLDVELEQILGVEFITDPEMLENMEVIEPFDGFGELSYQLEEAMEAFWDEQRNLDWLYFAEAFTEYLMSLGYNVHLADESMFEPTLDMYCPWGHRTTVRGWHLVRGGSNAIRQAFCAPCVWSAVLMDTPAG